MKQFRSWLLLWCSVAILIGVALGSLGYGATALVSLGLLAVLAMFGCIFALSSRRMVFRDLTILFMLVVLGALYATLRTLTTPLVTASTELQDVTAVVVSNGSTTNTGQRIFIDLLDVQQGSPLRVRATIRSSESLRYGELLVIQGQLEPPRNSQQFNETGYLRAHRAQGTLFINDFEVGGERRGTPLLRWLHDTQTHLIARLHAIHLPERALVIGIVLGESSSLPARVEEAFRRTGTTHMLVASGANVAILAWMVEHILMFVGLRLRLFITSLLLLAFVVMTGGEASIVRAVILYLILILATLTGRRVHLPTLVAVVALVMAIHTPWIILFDASFQLSFAAVAGLLLFSDWLARYLPTWWLKEFLAPTLAAQVTTLPILLFSFGQLSLVAPFVNLVAVPLVLPIMIGGIATLALPGIRLISWLTEGVATLLLWLVSVGTSIPWASLTTETNRLLWSSIALSVVVVLIVLRYRFAKVGRD